MLSTLSWNFLGEAPGILDMLDNFGGVAFRLGVGVFGGGGGGGSFNCSMLNGIR